MSFNYANPDLTHAIERHKQETLARIQQAEDAAFMALMDKAVQDAKKEDVVPEKVFALPRFNLSPY